MKTLWEKIADVLTEIQNGDGAEFKELTGIEKAFIAQETDRILKLIEDEKVEINK